MSATLPRRSLDPPSARSLRLRWVVETAHPRVGGPETSAGASPIVSKKFGPCPEAPCPANAAPGRLRPFARTAGFVGGGRREKAVGSLVGGRPVQLGEDIDRQAGGADVLGQLLDRGEAV